MATIFVETLDRRGKVAERVRVDQFPAIVGRAYSSAVIVDDVFVSPSHLRLEEAEGNISVVDISNANGLVDGDSGRRVTSLTLVDQAVIQIGSTLLRIRSEAFGLEPPRPYPGGATITPRGWVPVLETGLWTVLCLGFLALLSFLETAREVTLAGSLEELVGWLFLLFVWTGSWAFASNALAHESFFSRHLKIASLGLVALPIWDTVISHSAFFLSLDSHPSLVETIGATLISITVVYRHFSLVSRHDKRRRRLIAGALASLALVGVLISEFAQRDGFDWFPNHFAGLEPIPPRFLPSHQPEVLFESMHDLRQQVDQLAEEADQP